jgi:hypothetical protein
MSTDAQRNKITATQLAIDREVEGRQIAQAPLQVQLGTDRPHVTRSHWRSRADDLTFVPRRTRNGPRASSKSPRSARSRAKHSGLIFEPFTFANSLPWRTPDVAPNGYALDRASVRQKKTGRPVRFELTEQPRQSVDEYLRRIGGSRHSSYSQAGVDRRQYARLVARWVSSVGLDPRKFATHSMRRTKATLIYRTGNLRAVQLLLGHIRIKCTIRYLGVEVDDALEIAEKIDVRCTWAELPCSARQSQWAKCAISGRCGSLIASARRANRASRDPCAWPHPLDGL